MQRNNINTRGLQFVNGSTEPQGVLGEVSAAVFDMKQKHAKELDAMGKDLDKINGQIAAMKIGGAHVSDATGGFTGFGQEGTALADFGRTGSHFNAALSSDDLGKGGALVMPKVSNQIKIRQFDQSALARLARRVPLPTGDGFEEPWDLGEVGDAWVGEREERPKTDTPNFHLLSVPLHEVYCSQAITQRLLDDSAYPLGEWLGGRIADKHGRSSGSAFMLGNGVKKPRGLTTYPLAAADDADRPWVTIQALYTGVDGALPTSSAADILIDAVYALSAQFRSNAVWIMDYEQQDCRRNSQAQGW